MPLILVSVCIAVVGLVIAVCIAFVGLVIAVCIKRRRDKRELELHSITPDELHTLLAANREVLLFDLRQPLDLLGDSEIIVGRRIPPKEVLQNPLLIPRDKDSVVYCTCPSDKTSRLVLHRAQAMKLSRVKFLRGGLAAWKARGYPVERYEQTFRLDTRT